MAVLWAGADSGYGFASGLGYCWDRRMMPSDCVPRFPAVFAKPRGCLLRGCACGDPLLTGGRHSRRG